MKRIKLDDPVWDRVVIVNDSSMVNEVKFCLTANNAGVLRMTFSNGTEYEYFPVKPLDFGMLIGASSIGSDFQKYLKMGIIPQGRKVE